MLKEIIQILNVNESVAQEIEDIYFADYEAGACKCTTCLQYDLQEIQHTLNTH